ncbi:MAG: leucine-rich repeat domain-containing protein, partial [Thermoguttaceae bacterium]|nr:leucine-rich repeat domain-containing protein [Thermoguttaceae bacterium]
VGCKALETFDWPKSLKQIGGSAFSDCASLKSLTGATSLESIGDSAFSDCKALETVELPNGLREIGAGAFLNDEFTSIKIPASVKVLGPAGVACTGLEKIEVEEGNEILKVVDGALLSKDGKRLHRLPPALKKKSYKIPDGVEIVGRSALGGNVTLETVELPASVTTLERDAFYRCVSLKAIAIPAKTEQIDKSAFAYCDNLARFEIDPNNAVYKSENGALLSKDGKTFYGVVAVERDPNAEPFVVEPSQDGEEPRSVAAYKSPIYRVPDGVTTISNDAFRDPRKARNAFTEIVLPEGLIVIGSNVFNDCERLETMRVPASVTQLGSWVTAEGAPSSPFPQLVFASNRALKTFEVAPENKTYRSVDGMLLSADGKVCHAACAKKDRSVWKVPDGVIQIASGSFNKVDATEVVLPESLEFIPNSVFQNCENLTSITIPKNVKQISSQAFYNCPRLAEVVLKSSDTLYVSNSFDKVAPNLTIRVDDNDEPSQAPVETSTAPQGQAVESAKNVSEAVPKTLNKNDFKWRKEKDGATIFGVLDETATTVVIPETLGGLPVKAVGVVAFARMRNLKTVRISRNLETIGSRAFAGCVKLETIEFAKDENGDVASNLREIGDDAFSKCAALKSFAAPDSLVKLGGWAFCDCPSLETVTLGKNLQNVSSCAFANCGALSRVDTTVCEKLTGIANDAFLNCGALSSFDAPKSLRYVHATAFAGRSTPLAFNLDPESEFLKLVDGCLITIADEEVNDKQLIAYFGERSGELVVPEGVVNVFLSAFAGADFETVRLPKSVRVINNEAFKDCKSLKRVVIPEDSDLKAIGNTAFGGCESLETFDWPKSLKVICALAFVDCKSLKSFTGATSVEEIRDSAFANCRSLATIELPSGLRQVGMTAFGNVGYETLKIPASLQVLGESAFASLSPREKLEVEEGSETLKIVDGALLSKDGKTFYRLPLGPNATSYKVPEGVEIIENGAFHGNATLETVELPTTLKAIKKNAFYRSFALKEIAIPANVEQIDVEAFDGCDALERFEVDSKNAVYKSENGALLSADGKTFYKLIAVERDPSASPLLLLPLAENAASRSETPDETWRFDSPHPISAYKSWIYRVPDGVTTISDGAFYDSRKARNGFKEIVLLEGLVVIGANAFGGCSRLETLRIPASVSQLGPSSAFPTTLLFADCDALKTFEIAPENKNFRSEDGMLISPDGTVFYGVVANKKRSVLKFPAGVVHLTGDRNLGDPDKIVFPDSLTSIPQGKFRNLANLTSVTISKNIYKVDNSTFVDCPRLAEVVLRSKTTACSEEAFVRCAPNLTIRVEEGDESERKTEPEIGSAKENAASVATFKYKASHTKNALITGVYDKNATTLEIPETIGGLRVATIDANAFAEMRELRSVRIPASVETIRSGAFRNCVKLEKIEFAKSADGKIPSSLKTLESFAFTGCRALKSFEAPDSLARVGMCAFLECSSLETVTLGENVAVIEASAFADCGLLRRVDFSKVKYINYFDATAFDGTTPELEIVAPVGNPRFTSEGFLLTEDGKRINAYLGKRSGEISIPEGVERIENEFFWRFAKVETIRLPKSLRFIGDRAFYRCEALKRVVIPEDSALETIGANAFSECFALERFDWPKSLKTIGVSAFCYCRSLKSFTGATSVQKIGVSAFCDCESLTEIELPSGLVEIGPSAFADCG